MELSVGNLVITCSSTNGYRHRSGMILFSQEPYGGLGEGTYDNQIAELKMTRKTGSFAGHTFHETTISGKD